MFPEKIKSDYENILRQYMKEADLAKEKDKELVALHEKKRAEEKAEKERQEKEARAKELAEKRAKISEFTFGPVKLSLTPLQMVKDSLPDYDIITTFPVEQSGNQIKTSKEKLNFENIQVFRKVLEPHEDFFRYTKPKTTHDYRWYSNQELVEHQLELPQDVLAELGIEINCVLDIEKNREDKLRTRIIAIYYTLPGQQPKMLYYKVLGDILADAEEVYKERYGEPETQAMAKGVQEMVWRSPSEIAILRAPLREADLQIASLLVLSQTGYDEIFGMLHKKKEAATREAAEKEKQQQEEQKKAREARKSRI